MREFEDIDKNIQIWLEEIVADDEYGLQAKSGMSPIN